MTLLARIGRILQTPRTVATTVQMLLRDIDERLDELENGHGGVKAIIDRSSIS